MASTPRELYVVTDHHSAHPSKVVQAFLKTHEAKIEVRKKSQGNNLERLLMGQVVYQVCTDRIAVRRRARRVIRPALGWVGKAFPPGLGIIYPL